MSDEPAKGERDTVRQFTVAPDDDGLDTVEGTAHDTVDDHGSPELVMWS